MSKKNANLLVDAYCDLIEAKMPIVGKSQRRYMDELRRIATNYMRQNNYQANLEDLYGMYGTPDSVARKLAAIMTPEANPRRPFCTKGLISCFIKKTHPAPSAVPKKGIIIPMNNSIILQALSCSVFSHYTPEIPEKAIRTNFLHFSARIPLYSVFCP